MSPAGGLHYRVVAAENATRLLGKSEDLSKLTRSAARSYSLASARARPQRPLRRRLRAPPRARQEHCLGIFELNTFAVRGRRARAHRRRRYILGCGPL
jgi:hypothetical protein